MIQRQKSALGNALLVKRHHWARVQEQVKELTVTQLEKAIDDLRTYHRTSDRLVSDLLRFIEGIGMPVPNSFLRKLYMRREMKGTIVRFGMPAFWFTLNPSDLRHPLVMDLAGVQYRGGSNGGGSSSAGLQMRTATMNPVAVAQFFHYICTAFFDGLLGTSKRPGILGEVQDYYAVVETNGRGMLHLHGLIWLQGNVGLESLRGRMLENSELAQRMIRYMESVICEAIDPEVTARKGSTLATEAPQAKDFSNLDDYRLALRQDALAVAAAKQMHSPQHTATCFKYNRRIATQRCRFRKPESLEPVSRLDEHGVIHLRRNNPWVNAWNPVIALTFRSNHDISFLATKSRSLSVIYYTTNYATKDEVSNDKTLLRAVVLKKKAVEAEEASTNIEELNAARNLSKKFALRCFNQIAQTRQISGVQAASSLLKLPDHYTKAKKFRTLNLNDLRTRVESFLQGLRTTRGMMSSIDEEDIEAEQFIMRFATSKPVNFFEHYRYRGPSLQSLCLFEYCMTVHVLSRGTLSQNDYVDFASDHPLYESHVQRVAKKEKDLFTINFIGDLFRFQGEESQGCITNLEKPEIRMELAEILVGLFVPWQQIPQQDRITQGQDMESFVVKLWKSAFTTLTPSVRNYAQNLLLLKKSKEDCRLDAILRNANNEEDGPSVEGGEEFEDIGDGEFEWDEEARTESLLNNFFKLKQQWKDEDDRTDILRGTSWSRWPEREDRSFSQDEREEEQSGVFNYDETVLDIWKQELQAKTFILDAEPTAIFVNEQSQGRDNQSTVVLDHISNYCQQEARSKTISFAEFH